MSEIFQELNFLNRLLKFLGEAMEKGLRECCRSIRIGKILMTKDQDSEQRKVFI